MIKNYKLFMESVNTDREKEYLRNVIETIRKDCKPFLEDLERINSEIISDLNKENPNQEIPKKKGFLWRGVTDVSNIIFEESDHLISLENVNKNRSPRDMSVEVHDLLDDEFNKQFNIRPRSGGVFTSSDYSETMIYTSDPIHKSLYKNKPFLIFPRGEYKFIWSDTIMDLYSEIEYTNWYLSVSYEDGDFQDWSPDSEGWDDSDADSAWKGPDEDISKIVSMYRMDDFKSALLSGHEIVIMCDSYYLVTPHVEIMKEFYNRS